MITLLRSNPGGTPAAAATTTVIGVVATPTGSGSGAAGGTGPATSPPPGPSPTTQTPPPTTPSSTSPSPAPPPTTSTPPPARPTPQPPAGPQWTGDVQVGSLGESLATIPPTPDRSGDPDISAIGDGTFFASLGAAKWTSASPPSAQACATLILARNTTHVTAAPGDVYCLRVAHSFFNPGNQYATVQILGQGRDSTNFPYVRIHATVWPDADAD